MRSVIILKPEDCLGANSTMRMDSTGVSDALRALAEQLDYGGEPEIELVICGGSALQVLGLVDRTTRDVDVLALARTSCTGTVELIPAEPLPKGVVDVARIVARDLDLPADWLNPGPTDLLSQGLPCGLVERLQTKRYGSRLVAHFIGRFDQVCLKLYAVVTGGEGGRHLADLVALHPSPEEMMAAATWCLTQDASEAFPQIVRSCLEQIGYPDVAKSIENGL
jgi:hypothetical protein